MSDFVQLHTISDLSRLFRIDKEIRHPLIAVVDFAKVEHTMQEKRISADFYCMIFKNYCTNILKYGRKTVDFQNGSLVCMAPNQVIELDYDEEIPEQVSGWGIFFHPDLIRTSPLHATIHHYSFFSYEITEALHLSEKEKQTLNECVTKIQEELQENIDIHSQSIIVSSLELLLNYCTRFYGRQFITRKGSNNGVVTQVEKILGEYFKANNISEKGLPSVTWLAEQVNLSPGYLSDLLKKETGKNTQDHIHFYLIEEAKSILLNTNRSVGEIAYSLGFEYPQYFNRLFKKKTGKTPIEFRSLN